MMSSDNSRSASRFTTPLAAPPPPLHLLSSQQGRGAHNMHLPAYAGARHTLGPMFNDEEDGDDSAFIAQQMALLGLDKRQAQAEAQAQVMGRGQNGQNGQRRRNPPGNPNHGQSLTPNPSTTSRRNGRRQPRTQSHPSQNDYPYESDPNVDPSQQAAAYLALQAQAQQALLAAQIQAGGLDLATQHALAQRYQMQLQLAALQLQQQQQQHLPQHYQHQQQLQQGQNRSINRRASPNPQSSLLYQRQHDQQQHHQHHQQQQAYVSGSDERNHLAAQVQANLLARTRRQKNLDDAETRARFEAAPNVIKDQIKPFPGSFDTLQSPFIPQDPSVKPSEGMWRSEITKNPGSAFASRFGQPQPQRTPGGHETSKSISNDSLYMRTRAFTDDAASTDTDPSRTNTTAQTSPKSPASEFSSKDALASAYSPPYVDHQKTPSLGIGLGRPFSTLPVPGDALEPKATTPTSGSRPVRAWSSPSLPTVPLAEIPPAVGQPRSASYTYTQTYTGSTVIPTRQPFGPPGNATKLVEENFKANLRKRAGLGLTMLNRRASPTSGRLALGDDAT